MRDRDRAEMLRALATSMRSGLAPRAALLEWAAEVPPGARPHVRRMARRLVMGAGIAEAIETLRPVLGHDVDLMAGAMVLASDLGVDAAALVDSVVRSVERRAALTDAGRAAGAGTVLSGRLVAALPLVFVPLTPAARAPLLDGLGCLLLLGGLSLAGCGMWWIDRIVPRPPSGGDPVAALADALAGCFEAGAPAAVALDQMARSVTGILRAPLQKASLLSRLGVPWSVALGGAGDDGMRELASMLERSERGLAIASELRDFAGRRHEAQVTAFESAAKRASITMVIPLVVCVLPSFALLALAPFLRGMALSP